MSGSGVAPDIMAIAKGIGGGFPMGACLSTDEAASGMTAGVHGTTFGGNPLAMAVGNAVLDVVLADGFLDDDSAQGARHQAGPRGDRRRVPRRHRRHSRHRPDARPEVRDAQRHGQCALRDDKVLAVPAGDNVVRLLPPLVISEEEIRIGLERIRDGVKSLAPATSAAAD